MPISPLKPIELIQTEIHNRLTPREKEDQLHSQLRGEEYQFTIEVDDEPRELTLRIENIGIDQNDTANIELRLEGYEIPTSREEWEEDLLFIYINAFLRGKGSASELGNPLMADMSVGGHSKYDPRISFWVSTTAKSGIWDAVGRVAFTISQYHREWFKKLREVRDKWSEAYLDEDEKMPLGVGAEVVEYSEDQNLIQGYGRACNYIQYKDGEDEEETTPPPVLDE